MASGRLLVFVLASFVVVSSLAPLSSGDDGGEDYAIFVSVDETKVNIESGNLTLAVTHDSGPRLSFWHTVDPFSPTFEVGFPKLYLFNDSDLDGVFSRSEAVYTAHMDSNHAEWNLSTVESGYRSDTGEYVAFSMSAVLDAYNETIDAPPSVEAWANVTFWFRLTENEVEYENAVGGHTVAGKTEIFVNMTVEVVNATWLEQVAIERSLQGGASTDTFLVLEDGPGSDVDAALPGSVNENLEGEDFTRPLNGTEASTQCIDIAKEDGTVQAFYHWGSRATNITAQDTGVALNSSCYTTGTGLILHSALPVSNGTVEFMLDSSLGIEERGFVGGVTDWMKEIGYVLIVAGVAVSAAAVVGFHILLRRRRKRLEGQSTERREGPQ